VPGGTPTGLPHGPDPRDHTGRRGQGTRPEARSPGKEARAARPRPATATATATATTGELTR
jgi:hypothetical protein